MSNSSKFICYRSESIESQRKGKSMDDFILLFRWSREIQPSPEQMQQAIKHWQDWIGRIAAQNKLGIGGNRLSSEGKVVRSNDVVTDGPYVEIKEALGGYIAVKAHDFNDAVEIAKGCPIVKGGGTVEVRKVVSPQDLG